MSEKRLIDFNEYKQNCKKTCGYCNDLTCFMFQTKNKKVTNFDKITESPEKLAEYIRQVPCGRDKECHDVWLSWLKQEVKDEDK